MASGHKIGISNHHANLGFLSFSSVIYNYLEYIVVSVSEQIEGVGEFTQNYFDVFLGLPCRGHARMEGKLKI